MTKSSNQVEDFINLKFTKVAKENLVKLLENENENAPIERMSPHFAGVYLTVKKKPFGNYAFG